MNFSIPFNIPAAFKIIDSEIHPVHSWLLVTDEERSIQIWDYSVKTVIFALSLKDSDDKDGGSLKTAKFLDPHVLRWKWLRSQDLSGTAFQGKGREKYWIIIVMDYKLLFIDYRTGEKKSISYLLFENKAASCIEVVDSSYLAVGFADGSIRLFDLEDWEVVKVFPRGTHSKTITHLLSYSKNLSQRSLLISASGEGSIAVWNVDTCTDIPAFLIQSGSSSAHSGLIYSMSLNIETAQLFVSGSDSCLTVWNISNSTLVHRYKNLKAGKRKVLGGCFFNHPVLAGSNVLVHTGNNVVFYFDSLMFGFAKDAQNVSVLVELSGAKLISLKVHPLLPYLIFATSEEGVFPIYLERNLPQSLGYSDLLSSTINPGISNECHFFYYYQKDTLSTLIFSSSSESQSLPLLTRPIGNKVQLKVSPSGHYLSCLSSSSGLFDIYSISNDPSKVPDRLKSGYSSHLVWDHSSDRFACICPLNEDETPGSFVGSYFKILLLVYEVNNNKVCLIFRGDSMAKPLCLFGGRALGVSEDPGQETIFYSWESLKPISGSIPRPVEVYWTDSACVICYKQEFFVYSYLKTLDFRYKINASVRTGLWSFSVFFFTTDAEVYWLVPCIGSVFLFASHAVDNPQEDEVNIKEDQISQKVYRKPHEYCTVSGIFQGNLVVVTAGYRVITFPIVSSFLRFCLLVGSGFVVEAIGLTSRMQDNLHCLAAQVLVFQGFPENAIGLDGISYWKRLKIAVKAGIEFDVVRIK
jgi:WD40 repeat protein